MILFYNQKDRMIRLKTEEYVSNLQISFSNEAGWNGYFITIVGASFAFRWITIISWDAKVDKFR
ncbi:hypothetical protein I1300191J6_38590 [Parabacteroides distasonis]|nr:hypothetical protein DN0286_39800 [Parabacteroides distasonis]